MAEPAPRTYQKRNGKWAVAYGRSYDASTHDSRVSAELACLWRKIRRRLRQVRTAQQPKCGCGNVIAKRPLMPGYCRACAETRGTRSRA